MEVPDPLAVENLISYRLSNRRKLARLITQYGKIFSNISEGTAFLLQGVTENENQKRKISLKEVKPLDLSNDPGKNCTIFYCSAAIGSPHVGTVVFFRLRIYQLMESRFQK